MHEKQRSPISVRFTPAMAMSTVIRQKGLRPYLLVHPNCLPDLPQDATQRSSSGGAAGEFDSVVLGDAADGFNYANLNRAFRVLEKTGGQLYSLGLGKYYAEDGELTLDVGPFAAALEFATGRKAAVCGKPSADFFRTALADMGLAAAEAVMVGDDVVSDVGGAQACGMQGVLVRTGKFRESDESHPSVKPDLVVDNLAALVDKLVP